jgi:ADP-heptose:LPS heptosyltransferase
VTTRTATFVFLQYSPSSIGEEVAQIPFFHFLRKERPETKIVAVAPGRSGRTLEALGIVDRLVTYPVRGGWTEMRSVVGTLRGLRCERVWLHRRKSLRAALLARVSTGAPIDGFAHGATGLFQRRSIPFATTGTYIGENYVRLLGRGVEDYAAAAPPQPNGYVVFVPGGRTEIKRYPLARYLEIARVLADRLPVRFLLGPDQEAERTEIGDSFETLVAPAIPDVRDLLGGANLVIANDCGPAHFAYIRDVPRVSLFDRSVDASHWFWPGKNGRLLESPAPGTIDAIPAAEVLRHADELLGD